MFLIRHGQSQFNEAFSRTGRDPLIVDAPLTARGEEQARAAARKMTGKKITRLFCSPYTRALQTAAPIAEALNLPVQVDPLLGERRLYTCDIGTPCASLRTRWQTHDFVRLEKEEWWPAAHESEEDIERRVHAFMALRQDDADMETTVIVSHWYFIFTLAGMDAENAEILEWNERERFFKERG
jgi:broad specificity phosphatase PhoE